MQDKLISGLSSTFSNVIGQQYLKWLKIPPSYLRIMQSVNYRNGMYAGQQIKANSQIMLISTEKCFTSVEFVGCDNKRASDLQAIATQIAHKFCGGKIEQEYLISGLLKIILQIFVHEKDQGLNHTPFANILQPPVTPLFWSQGALDMITSRNFSNIIQSTLVQCNNIYNELQMNRLYGMSAQEFLKLFQITRSQLICFNPQKPKYFDMQSVQILCPLIYQFEHSFNPNCYLDGCYLSHENMSFVDVSSKKIIEAGDKLTINYGEMSNHDLLMRHGITVEDNPFNEMAIELDFSDCVNFSEQLFDQKQKWLRQSEIQNIERQVLYQNRINVQLLQYLRIYFLTEEEYTKQPTLEFDQFKEQISDENEQLVKQFMIRNIKATLTQYKQLSKPVGKELQDLYKIQKDEMTILQNNLNFFSKQ